MALTTVSCEDFLGTEPIDKIDVKQYYTDEKGLMAGLAGVYDPLTSEDLYANNMSNTYNMTTDENFDSRSYTTTGLGVNIFTTADASIANLWKTLYLGINRANDFIANASIPQMDETKRQAMIGEALFLRGYYHYLLVSFYGNVPLKLTPTTNPNDVYVEQTPLKDVYAQILKDMTEAEGKVLTSSDIGSPSRVSKTVVQGILARVCLQMAGFPLKDTSKYAEALAWAKKVQASGEHALNTTFDPSFNTAAYVVAAPAPNNIAVAAFTNSAYRQIFINLAQDKYNIKECMWEADMKGNRYDDAYQENSRLGSTNGIAFSNTSFLGTPQDPGFCWGFVRATTRHFLSYKSTDGNKTSLDTRRDWNLAPFSYKVIAMPDKTNIVAESPNTNVQGFGRDIGKWRRRYELNKKNQNFTNQNFPILRYSDVLLMIAEASNQVNNGPNAEAITAINQVRRRGYGVDINTPSVTADLTSAETGGKDSFQKAIEDERMRELCYEGLRRFDLIRWGKYLSNLQLVANDYMSLGSTNGNYYASLGSRTVAGDPRFLLYPIPSKEMAINKKLVQNPGW